MIEIVIASAAGGLVAFLLGFVSGRTYQTRLELMRDLEEVRKLAERAGGRPQS